MNIKKNNNYNYKFNKYNNTNTHMNYESAFFWNILFFCYLLLGKSENEANRLPYDHLFFISLSSIPFVHHHLHPSCKQHEDFSIDITYIYILYKLVLGTAIMTLRATKPKSHANTPVNRPA